MGEVTGCQASRDRSAKSASALATQKGREPESPKSPVFAFRVGSEPMSDMP